jgi:ubiquinone biosynthesis protein COQ4
MQQQLTDTRLHPIAAFRAMRNLLRDREDTRQVFLLIDALRGKTTLRQLERFRQTEFGRKALADRRCLLERLNDRESLAKLPPGTLGRAYYEFMAAENLSADGLVKVSTIPQSSDDQIWFRERTRDMHDLFHVVTGYGRDPLGEACVVAFTYAQGHSRGLAVIAISAARRVSRALPGQPGRRAILEGYLRGRAAKWLIGADWEALLDRPVAEVREQFGIRPAKYYPQIIAAIGEGRVKPVGGVRAPQEMPA